MLSTKQSEIVRSRTSFLEENVFPRISEPISYTEFFNNFLLPNRPCLFSSKFTEQWLSRKEWCTEDNRPNFDFLKRNFGDATVPVSNCRQKDEDSHCKTDMKLRDYMVYWEEYKTSGYSSSMDCLYLKDFHFTREFPSYQAYETPQYFTSDWLNEFWNQRHKVLLDTEKNDYRFVYMGPKGSWTPLHADVFRSFSWSANICGRKKWIFFPPGEEENLKDKHGYLPFDVTSDRLNNPSEYPNYSRVKHKIEVIQEAGEIIFVPSGWHHQVENLEDTISINHNWLNGCNVDISWHYIKQGLAEVEVEIQDNKASMLQDKEWYSHCQIFLKALKGINYPEYLIFMKTILNRRLQSLEKTTLLCEPQSHLNPRELDLESLATITSETQSKELDLSHPTDEQHWILFDIERVRYVLEDMLHNPEFTSYCDEYQTGDMTDIRHLLDRINSLKCKE